MSVAAKIKDLMESMTEEEKEKVYLAIAELLLQSRLYSWMKSRISEAYHYNERDLFLTLGEVNTTRLAEEAVYESGLIPEELQEAAIEDETHLVWDSAVDAAEWWESSK